MTTREEIHKSVSKKEKHNILLEKLKKILPKDAADKVMKTITEEMDIPPKVALIGKSGVGKTTTINNLFNVDWHTSDAVTGTTEAQEEIFPIADDSKLIIVDMPGLGDSIKNDQKFIEIYKRTLPEADVALYLIQADDDAIGEDVRIIKEIIQNCGEGIKKKLAIGINKVDLLGNGEGLKWDELVNLPSDGQKILIDEKCAEIMEQLSNSLGIKMETIACYSAKKRYRLYDLLNVMIMQSGIKGWKISINPKDWTELCDPRVRELLQKAKEN